MTMIEQVRTFLLSCEHLNVFGPYMVPNITVDYLGEQTVQYTVESMPSNPILKKFIDGSVLKQFVFVFASIEPYGSDTLQNVANTGFYELFENWLQQKTDSEDLPEGWERIEALTSGYVFTIPDAMDRARYQMQCRVVYRVYE